MNIRKIALAASVMAVGAPAFSAVTVGDLQNASNLVVWHSGASASTFSVQEAVISSLCGAGTVNLYGNNASNLSASTWTVDCTSSVAGSPRLLYSKRDDGGSGVGISPLWSGQDVGFMSPVTDDGIGAAENCPASATATITIGSTSVNYFNCTGFATGASATRNVLASLVATDDIVLVDPTWGTSDIEPNKFGYFLNTPVADLDYNGTNDTITATVNAVTQRGLGYLVFGIPVNIVAYQGLQRAQFAVGSSCHPDTAGYDITAFANAANSLACMPSLGSSELRAIYSKGGAIRSVSDFANSAGVGLVAGTFEGRTVNNAIQICRRVDGSGTQAAFNSNVLGYPCDDLGNWLTPETRNTLATPFVHLGSSSGTVENCLESYNNGTTVTSAGVENTGGITAWAFGVQSAEKNAAIGKKYRFIKVDGVAPTLANVHGGDYYHFAQQSLNYVGTLSGSVALAYTAISDALSNPTKLGALGVDHPWGRSGWLADPSGAAPFLTTATVSTTAPVSSYVKRNDAGAANSCAQPKAFKGGTGVFKAIIGL
jgi:ABC-type phosphate transport system substrate-binding protein